MIWFQHDDLLSKCGNKLIDFCIVAFEFIGILKTMIVVVITPVELNCQLAFCRQDEYYLDYMCT